MPLSSALPIAAILVVVVALYAGVHWLVGVALAATELGRLLRRALRPTVITIGLFAVLILAFAAIASPLRIGTSGLYREGASRDAYLAAARTALALIYLAGVGSGVTIAAASASRHERARLAATTGVSVLVFMLLAAPITEGVSECYANVTMLLKPSC
jgi:hypothetical protein